MPKPKDMPEPAGAGVPVVLVTGFLGAGKTTFINDLLLNAQGLRIAAIVNDFGSINIDATLLESASDAVIGLKNGCICCSLQGDLLRTLRQVLQDGQDGRPDLILIEASGIADPRGIVQGLMDPVLFRAAALDSIVCIADVEDLLDSQERWQDPLWQAQISAADIVQLSKVSTLPADDDRLATLVLRLGALGKATVLGTDGTTLAVTDLIGRAGFRLTAEQRPALDSGRFASVEWICDSPVSLPGFQAVIGELSGSLLRAKGWMQFREKPGDCVLFQMVGRRANLSPSERNFQGCRLVLIGESKTFEPEDLTAKLDSLAKLASIK
jgi:G3E family GTPase